MKRGGIKVTYELLHEVLKLPEDLHIDEVFVTDQSKMTRSFCVALSGTNEKLTEHPEFYHLFMHPLEELKKTQ